MIVPFLDLKAQYARIRDEIRPALDRVIESQSFILGPEVEALERDIAAYSGTSHAIGVSSGTDGLLVALMALDIKPGDEVISTPFSFFATAGVIARLNAIPVFVDIDPTTFNIDPVGLLSAISSKTRAIIPVHLFGQCANMGSLLAVAHKHNIPVIEDACQSIGAEYEGRKAGALGDIGVFSFFPSKNLGAFGDGGMVLTSDQAFATRLRSLRAHGSTPGRKYHHEIVGGNFRIDALQAAILRVKLPHLEAFSTARARNAARYRELLAGLPIELPPVEEPGERCVYNQFVIRAEKRDALQAWLKEHGVGTEVYYPVPLHLQPCFASLRYGPGSFPEAESAAKTSLALPIYPELKPEQLEYVADQIRVFFGG